MADDFADDPVQSFTQDMAAMRASIDGTLTAGFVQAGDVLERSLVGAVAKGNSSFLDLRTVALKVIDDIAASAAQGVFGGGTGGLGSLLGALAGLPGRATGGPVSPGQAYVVGERGPELFVPTSAGSVAAGGGAVPRDVRVTINLNAPAGTDPAQALQRSSRQVAAALRRALAAN
jgi:phage-related minor tail protein